MGRHVDDDSDYEPEYDEDDSENYDREAILGNWQEHDNDYDEDEW